MSKFVRKATTNSVNLTVLEGRAGDEMKSIAQHLLVSLSLSPEQLEDYFDAFAIFPLDERNCITMEAMKSFYESSGLELSDEDCRNAMRAFTGNESASLLNFESYVINMERWQKQDIHTSGILHTAYDVFCDGDDHRISSERLKYLFKSIKGPPLNEQDISKLVQHINIYCGDDDLYGFI